MLGVSVRGGSGTMFCHVWAPRRTRRVDVGEMVLPERFTISRHLSPDERVLIDVQTDERGPRCVGVRIDPASGALTSAALRLPIDQLLAAASSHMIRLRAGRELVPLSAREIADAGDVSLPGRERRRVTDAELQRVAEVYRAAVKTKRPPTQTVASELHYARSTAGRLVKRARKAGYLGRALSRRGGEAI